MSMKTYTFRVSETESGEGISADVYNDDGTIERSAAVAYDDYGLTASREGDGPEDLSREVTADVLALDLQFSRNDGGFDFRLLGDGEELERLSVVDDDWGLGPAET